MLFGDFGGDDLPNTDGLTVQIFAIAGNSLKPMTDGVAKIQYCAQSGFSFIFSNNFRLDLATSRYNRGKSGGIVRKKFGEFALQTREQFGIVNDAILDDFCEAGTKFTRGQSAQYIEITKYKLGLMERSHEIFPCRQVHSHLSAH